MFTVLLLPAKGCNADGYIRFDNFYVMVPTMVGTVLFPDAT